MWVTDLAGSIYLADLDGASHKQILAAQGNLTRIAYAELPRRGQRRDHRKGAATTRN